MTHKMRALLKKNGARGITLDSAPRPACGRSEVLIRIQ